MPPLRRSDTTEGIGRGGPDGGAVNGGLFRSGLGLEFVVAAAVALLVGNEAMPLVQDLVDLVARA